MNLFNKKAILALGLIAGTFTSCKEDNQTIVQPTAEKEFQLAFASGSGSISGTYLQGVKTLEEGHISFEGKGYKLSEARTSRVFHSADGKYVYSLSFQQGTVDKLEFLGGSNYKLLTTLDASVPLGTKSLRFYKLNEEVGSLHFINSKPVFEADQTTYKHHEMSLTIGLLDFSSMSIKTGFVKQLTFTMPGELANQGYHITRIDCPILLNGKLYYGAALSKYNPATNKNVEVDLTMTLVVDYNDLTKVTVVKTDLVSGSSNGYRTPTQHLTENGEVIQMVQNRTAGKTFIVKMKNGQYDGTYKFSLDEALGRPGKTSSNGFFYAGNGIVFMPYEKKHLEQIQIGVDPSGNPTYSSAWGIARIDLNTKTAVDLEVPDGLWLMQWQNSVVRNGKFYIALSPVGQAGHIYSYDVNSTNGKGTKGATTTSGADQYFIGIY